MVFDWEADYDGREDPDEYFDSLVESLGTLHEAYPEGSAARSKIMDALTRIEDVSEGIREELEQQGAGYEPDSDYYDGYSYREASERSIFDDVYK